MLIEQREALRTKGIPQIEHRALAELAGYVCQEKYRTYNDSQEPNLESKYVTVVNVKLPVPKETDVAAPSAVEAWQTFLTMIWRPDQNDEQCREVLIGAMLDDKEELGRQIQADVLDLHAPIREDMEGREIPDEDCVWPNTSFSYDQIVDFALMTKKATLRAVRACAFFRVQVEKLEALLSGAATPSQPTVDDQLPSAPSAQSEQRT